MAITVIESLPEPSIVGGAGVGVPVAVESGEGAAVPVEPKGVLGVGVGDVLLGDACGVDVVAAGVGVPVSGKSGVREGIGVDDEQERPTATRAALIVAGECALPSSSMWAGGSR